MNTSAESICNSIAFSIVSFKSLYSAILSLNYYKGFSVIRTFSLEETAIFVCNTVNKLKKGEVEKKKPYYGKIEEKPKERIYQIKNYSSVFLLIFVLQF